MRAAPLAVAVHFSTHLFVVVFIPQAVFVQVRLAPVPLFMVAASVSVEAVHLSAVPSVQFFPVHF